MLKALTWTAALLCAVVQVIAPLAVDLLLSAAIFALGMTLGRKGGGA